MRRLYKITLIIIIVITLTIGLFIIKQKNKVNVTETETEISSEYRTDLTYNELSKILISKGNDWSELPLTKKFKEKYNSDEGVLRNIKFDYVEIMPDLGGKYPFEDFSYFVITSGKKKTAYSYYFIQDENGLYDDFYVGQIYELIDENGNNMDAKSNTNEDNFISNFYMLSDGYEREQCIGVTNKFHTKYPYFLDIFEHYSPLMYNNIKFIKEKSSWEKKEAYFEVDSVLECKKRYYLVEFTLDDKGYLDDVVVHKVNEVEYEGNKQERINKITYQNSNWDNLKLTDYFRKKFFRESGIVEGIENINIDIPVDEISLEMNTKYITCFTSKSGEIIAYYFEYIKDKDGNLDNVVCEKLPYINKTAEEVKELYLKEYNK